MLDAANLQTTCPKCKEAFVPARSNQKYCSSACQKAATRNVSRGPRQIAVNMEERRRHDIRTGRIQGLSDAFFTTPPAYRAEFMERLITEGRTKSELRKGLTEQALLRSWSRNEGTGRLHIAHCLDHYCQEVYKMRSYEVLAPATVRPSTDDLAFPAAYFGPDAPPVYEDGSLKKRPCPWATRHHA